MKRTIQLLPESWRAYYDTEAREVRDRKGIQRLPGLVELRPSDPMPNDATVFEIRPLPGNVLAEAFSGRAGVVHDQIIPRLRDFVTNWWNVIDQSGEEIPFSPDLLEQLPYHFKDQLAAFALAKTAKGDAEGNELFASSSNGSASSGRDTTDPRAARSATPSA